MMEEKKGGWLLRKEEGEKGLKEEMVFVLPIWLCLYIYIYNLFIYLF
jgi:hypothetical protein